MLGSGISLGLDTSFRIFRSFRTLQEVKLWIYEKAFVTSMLLSTAAIFTSVAQSIFVNTVLFGLRRDIPDFNADYVLLGGFSSITEAMTEEQLPIMLNILNSAFVNVSYLTTAMAVFSIFGGLFAPCEVPLASYHGDTVSSTEEAPPELPTWSLIFNGPAAGRLSLRLLAFFRLTIVYEPNTWDTDWRHY